MELLRKQKNNCIKAFGTQQAYTLHQFPKYLEHFQEESAHFFQRCGSSEDFTSYSGPTINSAEIFKAVFDVE